MNRVVAGLHGAAFRQQVVLELERLCSSVEAGPALVGKVAQT